MDPFMYWAFGSMGVCAITLIAIMVISRVTAKRDDNKIHAALKPHEQTTLHLSDVTGVPIPRVHMAVDRLAARGVRSRFAIGGPGRNYHQQRMVSLPQPAMDSTLSPLDIVIAEEVLSSPSSAAASEAPAFQSFGGGDSGGAGASDSWGSSSDSSSSSCDSSSSDSGSCDSGSSGGGDS